MNRDAVCWAARGSPVLSVVHSQNETGSAVRLWAQRRAGGAGSLKVAGAVVPQDMQIPPGSLVAGVPAKVRQPGEPWPSGRRRNRKRLPITQENVTLGNDSDHIVTVSDVYCDARTPPLP